MLTKCKNYNSISFHSAQNVHHQKIRKEVDMVEMLHPVNEEQNPKYNYYIELDMSMLRKKKQKKHCIYLIMLFKNKTNPWSFESKKCVAPGGTNDPCMLGTFKVGMLSFLARKLLF